MQQITFPQAKIACFLTVLACSLLFLNCNRAPDDKLDPEDFLNPPAASAVHTWWHWMDNNITREGISKDLESMKSQGITTATLFNIGILDEKDFGIPHVLFNTDEWYEMFKWTLENHAP